MIKKFEEYNGETTRTIDLAKFYNEYDNSIKKSIIIFNSHL